MFGISKYSIISAVIMMMVLSSSKISLSSDIQVKDIEKEEFFQPVIDKLTERGVDSNFIYKLIDHSSTEFNEKFVLINVTGYLKKADYSENYNDRSITKSKNFLNKNLAVLQLAELKYGVPKEVITSVLWVETRHGSFLGKSHVASVYLSTAMCNEKKYLDINIQNLRNNFDGSEEELQKLEKKIIERSEKKANWALDQLVAMAKIDSALKFNPLEIRGSWAGAFGISQFLPTSYLQWAVDGNGDGIINLFSLPDAIFSVANYLHSNGWGDEESDQRKAVFHYNNSNAYVDAVLKLAYLIKDEPPQEAEIPKTEEVIRAQAGKDN